MHEDKDVMFKIALEYLKTPDSVAFLAMRKGADLRAIEARAKLILLNRELGLSNRITDHSRQYAKNPGKVRAAMVKVYGKNDQ